MKDVERLFTADEIIKHLSDVAFGIPDNGIRSRALIEGIEIAQREIRSYANPERSVFSTIRSHISSLEVGFGVENAYKVACNMLDEFGNYTHVPHIHKNGDKLGVRFI
tara:strand:- start:150 stop:473 length:324 start_codon:yes stop_codon:yes gene_type:complete